MRATTATDRPSPAIAAPEIECDADAGVAPGPEPEGRAGPDDPGRVELPGDCDDPGDAEDDREEEAVGVCVGEPLRGALGLPRAPGMPTEVSTAFTLPAVHEE